jgi:hypothetical protein
MTAPVDKAPHLWGGWAEYVYVDLKMLPGQDLQIARRHVAAARRAVGALDLLHPRLQPRHPYRTRNKYPWLEMQTIYPFTEEGIGRAVADAMARKTVKSTIVPGTGGIRSPLSCPGRGAAFSRRCEASSGHAAPQSRDPDVAAMGPGSAVHHAALRRAAPRPGHESPSADPR